MGGTGPDPRIGGPDIDPSIVGFGTWSNKGVSSGATPYCAATSLPRSRGILVED